MEAVKATDFSVISPHAGFALMKMPALLNAAYERSPLIIERFPESQSSPGDVCVEDKDLGFDIGYWGSDSYSIICDSAIWPRWHGPYDDVLPELATRLTELNSNCLFQSHERADRFRSWYRTQDWAEEEGEPGEFCIIKVEAVCAK